MDPNIEERLDNILMHYGVKGMKWGVRRTPAQLGHRPSSRRRKSSATAKGRKRLSGMTKKKVTKKTVTRRKKAAEFSDEDLERAIKRLNLEKQYNDLVRSVSAQEQAVKGKKFSQMVADDILVPAIKGASKEVLKTVIKESMNDRRKRNRNNN